jgi:hypothetical protein
MTNVAHVGEEERAVKVVMVRKGATWERMPVMFVVVSPHVWDATSFHSLVQKLVNAKSA